MLQPHPLEILVQIEWRPGVPASVPVDRVVDHLAFLSPDP